MGDVSSAAEHAVSLAQTSIAPASPIELDMWLGAQREPNSSRYVVTIDLEIDKPVEIEVLRDAFRQLVSATPALRASYSSRAGTLERVVHDEVDLHFSYSQTHLPYAASQADRWASQIGALPINTEVPPLARCAVLGATDATLVVIAVHHLIADAWSLELLADRFVAAVFKRVRHEVSAATSAVDDLRLRPEADAEADGEPDEEYWRELLAGECAPLSIPADFVRSTSSPGPSACIVSSTNMEGIRNVAGSLSATPANVILACWLLLLHGWSGEADGLVGVPFSGRLDPEDHERVGLLARVLPVRSVFDASSSFAEHVARISRQIMSSLEYSQGSLAHLRVTAGDKMSFHSVFQHAVCFDRSWSGDGMTIRALHRNAASAKHDVALAAVEHGAELRMQLVYDSDAYRRDSIELLALQMRRLLVNACARPERRCVELLSDLANDADFKTDAPARDRLAEPVHLRVLRCAARRPSTIAVQHGADSLTYAELASRAVSAAYVLRARGVREEDIVALLLPPGIANVVAMLATAIAGAAYLPLSMGDPDERLRRIIDDACPRLTICSKGDVRRLGENALRLHVEELLESHGSHPEIYPDVTILPTSLLNVLYTSGSTGQPKGVLLTHAGLDRLLERPEFLSIDSSDVVSHFSALNFDGATFEVWGALAHGARLLILDKELVLDARRLRSAFRHGGVTVALMTTPLLNRVIEEAPDALQTLKTVYFGGEMISVPHIRRARAWCNGDTLVHSYGPTENSFTSTCFTIGAVDDRIRTLPVGHTVPETEAHVVFGGTLHRAPPGMVGELLLGGVGVARGYLRDARTTAARFRPDPFSPRPGSRLYHTGDRVRRDAAGLLEFVGRVDEQVKIRSHRVELAEVGAAISAQPGVVSSFVTTVRDTRDETQLATYVVLAPGVTIEQVRRGVRAVLPPYAVPAEFFAVDALPLKENGKVDRSRLPRGESASSSWGTVRRIEQAVPADATVSAAWFDVLGRNVEDDVNFFDAGGHSLLLVKLQDAILRRVGRELSLPQLFTATTIRAQTHLVFGDSPMPSVNVKIRRDDGEESVAVVGMACRFAQSPDLQSFWRNLLEGRDCITYGPAESRVTELEDGFRRIAAWGVVTQPGAFDRQFFGYDPDDGAEVNPQSGVLYECLWSAVEDAGLRMSDIASRTSLYVGARAMQPPAGYVPWEHAMNWDPSFIATQFAYRNDLRGECLRVDDTCATSLVAIHLAAESLRRGHCDYALAGAVSASSFDGTYVYAPGGIYSQDGICRPFDRRATGTVGGDGAGAVILRRLSCALRDGDPIYAVIRGTAVTNEGRSKVRFTAPGVEGKLQTMRKALSAAKLDPADVELVEAHGTGVQLGDIIEATAIAAAFGTDGGPLCIGSVKASVGHCDTAAGMAAFIKTALAVRHGVMPATPNTAEPIDELSRFGSRFAIIPMTRPWISQSNRRTASVHGAGVGGTNGHIILQQNLGS